MKIKPVIIGFFLTILLLLSFNHSLQAQMVETFADGDFINTPTWSGDDSLFKTSTYSSSTWSVQPRLQLFATQAGGAHLRVRYPMSSIDSTEWRFWIRLSLSSGTSTTNNARVYLTSDSANLRGSLQGYFVMFGDDVNGALDNISLCKQTGLSVTKIISGTVASITSSKNIRVKVLRDNAGLWTLYADTLGGTNYQLEGSATDVTYPSSQYCGVQCKYTASNKSNFYFDDFFVGAIEKDLVPPHLTKTTILSENQLELTFSESVSPTTATTVGFYNVNQGIGTPTLAELDAANPSIVRLTFAAPFPQNLMLQLTVSGVTDLIGNAIVSESSTFSYYVPQIHDVVINEIMADPDPAVGLPNAEFVELKNNTSLPINLNGWLLKVGTSTKILPDYTLLPDSFVVITSAASLAEFGANVPIIGVSSCSITNSGQEISLATPTNTLMHDVYFSDSWYADSFKQEGGWSLEQIDPLNYCGESTNWRATTDPSGGTPGRKNSIHEANPDLVRPTILRAIIQNSHSVMLYFSESMDVNSMSKPNRYLVASNLGHPLTAIPSAPTNKSVLLTFADSIVQGQTYTLSVTDTIVDCAGNLVMLNSSTLFALAYLPQPQDVVINEILSNPREGGADFVELYNRSSKIIDLKQLLLGSIDNGGPVMKQITSEGYLLFPGAYVVLSANPLAIRQQYTTSSPANFVEMTAFPTYNNDDGVVVLTDLNGIEIDKVAYSLSMHYPLLKATDGVSLERLNPERSSVEFTNWHSAASTVGHATPGFKNSQWTDGSTSDNELTVFPEIFTPDNDGMDDVGNLRYLFSETGYRISIWVYNAAGFKVKQLANNDLAAMDGTYSWDGTSEDHNKVSSGIYLFYVEIWKLNGTVKRYKKPITVGARFK